MVEGGMKCVKYLLFIFNFLFFLVGLGLIIVGAIAEAKFKEMFTIFDDSKLSSAAVLIIVVGCIIFVIGFFGCCGAIKENYCMVMTFAVLLGVLFGIQISVGIAGFVMRNKLQSELKDKVRETLRRYNSSEVIKKTWDKLQNKFDCCGVTSKDDWKADKLPYPVSCCKKENQDDDQCTKKDADIKPDGCYGKIKAWVEKNIYIIAGVGVGLSFVQIIGVILACCLAHSIKKEYEVV